MGLIEIVLGMIVLSVVALAVTATILVVNSKEMRSAGGSSLDLQALNYARETLEDLKSAVSSDATRAAPLTNGLHDDATTALPAGDLLNHGGTRTYLVTDASTDAALAGTDLKKVTVTVQWTD